MASEARWFVYYLAIYNTEKNVVKNTKILNEPSILSGKTWQHFPLSCHAGDGGKSMCPATLTI